MGPCRTCRYWTLPLTPSHPGALADEGRCRRYPPVVVDTTESGDIVMAWVETNADDGCGEWQERA